MDELNIILDDELYQYINRCDLKEGIMILFPNLVCDGKLTGDIFSKQFHDERCRSLQMSKNDYDKKIVKPLNFLIHHRYKNLKIWTTYGMNQGMALLLLLGYLDQNHIHEKITIYLYDHRMRKLKEYVLDAKGYYSIYENVMVHHNYPKEILINPIQKAIPYYLEYQKKENKLKLFIKNNMSIDTQLLYFKFMEKFSPYQLTDQQFSKLLYDCQQER